MLTLFLRGLVPLAGGIAFLLPSAAFAKSQPDSWQKVTYEVYAGGINAVSASLDVAESKDRYAVDIKAKTRGFLSKLVPWEGTFSTEGWLQKKDMRPELHRSTARSSDGSEIKDYRYGQDGSFKKLTVTEDGKDESPKELDPALVDHTTDALTAALKVMTDVTRKGICEGQSEIFDGDRRFRLQFHHDGEDMLEPTQYNIYKGPAVRCTAEVTPLGGKWHKKPRGWLSIQEQGRKAGTLPTVWMAKLHDGAPAMPVKMRVKTDYGTLFMHMVDYANEETAENRTNDNVN